jgi:hypothetical protein
MINTEYLLNVVWPRVRKRHLYPEIPPPQYEDGEERVGLDIKAKKISLSKKFLIGIGWFVKDEDVAEGLLDHAVSHYLYCPWDLATHLGLYREAKTVLKDSEMARRATDHFMDVVADTYCVSRHDTPLPKIYRHVKGDNLDRAIYALCQKIWGVDMGIVGYEETTRKLSRLPYLERSRWKDSIRRFAKVIKPLLETKNSQDDTEQMSPMGSHSLQQYTEDEIEQGLKEIATESVSPEEFSELIKDFEGELLEIFEPTEKGMGLGPGRPLDADILYYMKLAESFKLPIRKIPLAKSGTLYPHHHIPWEVGKPYQDIDPWTSFGKVLPGLTQTWQRLEGEVLGQDEGTPNCMIIIDSSGSMTNPRKSLSFSVLGAACACESYLRNDADVAIYNFSDALAGDKKILPYTRNRGDIYQGICHYYGGGTQLMIDHIKDLQNDRWPDIFLITDMQITNLEMLIEYFNECKNRVTAVHIGNNRQVDTFCRSMKLRRNVVIYSVEKKEDIPHIILGKVKEYFHQ